MGTVEKLIFEQFPKMPAPVRVFVYLLFVMVFIYLLLVPRFVDGQLVVSNAATGGVLPYRGAALQLQVDGRSYKFRSSEDGFFSIPIVGRMPQSVQIQVLHMDKNEWFNIEIPLSALWVSALRSRSHRVEVLSDIPFVKLSSQEQPAADTLLARVLDRIIPTAHAQTLVLPKTASFTRAELRGTERQSIQTKVEATYAQVTRRARRDVGPQSPLSGAEGALSYVQRIQLVTSLENQFELRIPDDHWQQMRTLGQLVDYLAKRQQIARVRASAATAPESSWAQIQQSFPLEERPVYTESGAD